MEIKISKELNSILNYARQEASRTGSYGIAPDHLFLGILRHADNIACECLKALEADLEELKRFIDGKIFTNESIPYSESEYITFSRGAQNTLSITILEASRSGSDTASSQHLLLALMRSTGGYGVTCLKDIGIDYGRVLSYLDRNNLRTCHDNQPAESPEEENIQEKPAEEAKSPQKERSYLKEFGHDLTEAAGLGKLDPVVGRENEIWRVIQILGRRKKNNPMLVGEPGVGKSAIVEGIALKIASGQVPDVLKGKRIIALDIASVVAGTKYRGDFEKRLKAIMSEAASNPDVLLFIDEFHTVIGAGGASGSLDAANIMKPALARGEIQCIGATTTEEFTKTVEKDGALDRRFQKVMVEATDYNDTLSILKTIRDNYGKFHNAIYPDGTIEACVRLSERYITERCLPDKAVDVMDEAGSMVRLKNPGSTDSVVITEDDIATAISRMTGIPVGKVAESEGEKLIRMEDSMRERICGQDEAISKVVKAIRRSRAGIKDPRRPVGSFLFFGPTGVGKTQLAKSIAEYLFGSQDNLVRIDMSEYTEKFTASRLVGAPPGYVGYDEGGQLTQSVRRQPYSVVLLDEIEKAHPDIFNILLQVLDEGRLTDSTGRTVDFRNTILIMTSNVGSREVEEYGSGLGFSSSGRNVDSSRKAILEKAIRKMFPPEFINRIDEMVMFHSLNKDDISRIIDIELKDLRKRVSEAGYRLNVAPGAKKFVAGKGYDAKFGARPLKRAIQRYIEDPVSEYIILQRAGLVQDGGSTVLKVGLTPDKLDTRVTSGRGSTASPEHETSSEGLNIDTFEFKVTDDVNKGVE